MRVLVFGASGKTGREFVWRALDQDHDVTAFVRDPGKLGVTHPRLKTIQGNVGDAAAVAQAIAGQDVVVSALGVGKPLRHDQVVIDGVGHIVKAMESSGSQRLLYLSTIAVSFGRDAVGPMMRFAAKYPLRHEVGNHDIKERLIRPSAIDWTIVHAPMLTNGPWTGRYRAGETIEDKRFFPPMLSRADVAHAMVTELGAHAYPRKVMRLLPQA